MTTLTNEDSDRLERFLTKLNQAGDFYAAAAAEYELQENLRKVVLAEEMSSAAERGVSSVAGQEREGLISAYYLTQLQKIKTARQAMEAARARLEYLRLSASLRQSQLATQRAEIRAFN